MITVNKCVSSQKKGHKEEILCAAHCPPSLLATGSYDGEVIVWNVVSGHMQCRFPSPDEQQHTDGDVGPGKLTTGISHRVRWDHSLLNSFFSPWLNRNRRECHERHIPEEQRVTAVPHGDGSRDVWGHGLVWRRRILLVSWILSTAFLITLPLFYRLH